MWRNLDGGVNLKERTTGEECGNERKNKIKEEKTTSEKRRGRIIKDKDEDKEVGQENQMWQNLTNCYTDIVQAPRVYHAVDRMTSPVFDDRIASHGTSAVRSRW